MIYYHCSPTHNLTLLQPSVSKYFGKPRQVCMTVSLPMALFYAVKNFEYTYGYTGDGQIYYEEYFPDALRTLYAGKSASLYTCAPTDPQPTRIPNEFVSAQPVPVLSETFIPDAYEALLAEEAKGTLRIFRYETLSENRMDWIIQAEAAEIREKRLWETDSPEADYFRLHYPDSWRLAQREL